MVLFQLALSHWVHYNIKLVSLISNLVWVFIFSPFLYSFEDQKTYFINHLNKCNLIRSTSSDCWHKKREIILFSISEGVSGCLACLHVNQFVENLVSCFSLSLKVRTVLLLRRKIFSFCATFICTTIQFSSRLNCFSVENISSNSDQIEHNLHPTDDGKSSQETHGATERKKGKICEINW